MRLLHTPQVLFIAAFSLLASFSNAGAVCCPTQGSAVIVYFEQSGMLYCNFYKNTAQNVGTNASLSPAIWERDGSTYRYTCNFQQSDPSQCCINQENQG